MPAAEIKYGGDEEYRRLWSIRDRYGVTWRGMLLEGAKFIQEHDLIGENAPDYLECNGNGDRPGGARIEPEHEAPHVQRVDLTDRDLDCLQIEVTLVDADADPADETETTADADCPNGETAAPTSPDREERREGGNEGDPEPGTEPTETDEPEEVTSTAAKPTDVTEHRADQSPSADNRGGIRSDTRRQSGQRPTSPPTRPARFPGRGNNGE